ncbi:MAG: Flp family type IVb pilin [Alphaproteobacteria bacterium]|nr:MAG: Flp family type IVb pilin [Alphaproteobacteria bacterium]
MVFGKTRKLMADLARNDSGATAIEYALIASGIAIAIITGVAAVGTELSGFFSSLAAAL